MAPKVSYTFFLDNFKCECYMVSNDYVDRKLIIKNSNSLFSVWQLQYNGCVDGSSRRIIWLEVQRSNKNPRLVAKYFLKWSTRMPNTCVHWPRHWKWTDCWYTMLFTSWGFRWVCRVKVSQIRVKHSQSNNVNGPTSGNSVQVGGLTYSIIFMYKKTHHVFQLLNRCGHCEQGCSNLEPRLLSQKSLGTRLGCWAITLLQHCPTINTVTTFTCYQGACSINIVSPCSNNCEQPLLLHQC